jgi:tetratricopeptide (TPR) repeat protein
VNKKKVESLSHLVDLELLNNLSNSQIETELVAIETMLNTDQVDQELKPSYVYKQFFLAHRLGQYSKALNYIDDYIELAAVDYSVLANQGSTREKLGLLSAALNSYDQALELNSADEWIWINRGNVLAQLGQTYAAVSSYDRALELNPKSKIWLIREITANMDNTQKESQTLKH